RSALCCRGATMARSDATRTVRARSSRALLPAGSTTPKMCARHRGPVANEAGRYEKDTVDLGREINELSEKTHTAAFRPMGLRELFRLFRFFRTPLTCAGRFRGIAPSLSPDRKPHFARSAASCSNLAPGASLCCKQLQCQLDTVIGLVTAEEI